LNNILSETPPLHLYHYTDQKGLLGIVKKPDRQIWATHHQYLNDTQEFVHAKGVIRDEIEKRIESANYDDLRILERMRTTLDGPGNEEVNLYLASFSEDGDSLAQWRAYGGQAAGYALGLWGNRLLIPDDFTLARCIYEPEKQREVAKAIVAEVEHRLAQMPLIGDSNADFTAWATLLLGLHEFALIFKHEKFRGEQEWRIFSRVLMDMAPAFPAEPMECKLEFRHGKSMLIPYRIVPLRDNEGNFPIHEIIVGPNPNPQQSRRSVESLLLSQGLQGAQVRSSDIPYRNW
jgi:hypothetical protein